MNLDSSMLWGIIGVFVSILFYRIGNKTKKIIYTISSQLLISDSLSLIDGLNITYHDKPIKNLTSTTIKFKSIGKDTIEMVDFAKLSPLGLKTDGEIFAQTIPIKNSNPSNPIEIIRMDKSTVQLKYDFFKQNDIVTITLFHTGNLSVTGELKKGKIFLSESINKINIWGIIDTMWIILGSIFIFLISLPTNETSPLTNPIIKLIYDMIIGTLLINDFLKKYHFSNYDK